MNTVKKKRRKNYLNSKRKHWELSSLDEKINKNTVAHTFLVITVFLPLFCSCCLFCHTAKLLSNQKSKSLSRQKFNKTKVFTTNSSYLYINLCVIEMKSFFSKVHRNFIIVYIIKIIIRYKSRCFLFVYISILIAFLLSY